MIRQNKIPLVGVFFSFLALFSGIPSSLASVTSDITVTGKIVEFTQDWVMLEQEPGSKLRVQRKHFPEKTDLRPGDSVHLKLSNSDFIQLQAEPVKKSGRAQKPKTGQP